MHTYPIFASPSNACIFVNELDRDLLRWLHEHNFLLGMSGGYYLSEFMTTAPYTHPISWESDKKSLAMWDMFFTHIFNRNRSRRVIHEIRLHFVESTTQRIFQIVKHIHDDKPSIIYTDSAPEPYFTSVVLYGENEIAYHFNRDLYMKHWRLSPECVLSAFKSGSDS
jgi:hypothetical protein